MRVKGARRRQDDVGRARRGRRRRDLVGQRHRLDDEPRVLLRVQAGKVRLPVAVDLIARRAEEIELLRVGQALRALIGRRVEAAARADDDRRRAIGKAGISEPRPGDRVVDVRRKRLARRRIDALVRDVVRLREIAVSLIDGLLLLVIDRQERVVLVLREVARADRRGHVELLAAAAARRRAVPDRRVDARKVAAHDEIDHAADRVAAVDRRRAVFQHLDALDRRKRDRGKVHAFCARNSSRERAEPLPVDKHER